MRARRVSESEVPAAIRSAGLAAVESADAVVLDTDGSFSVMPEAPQGPSTAPADTSWQEVVEDRSRVHPPG